MKHQLKTDIRGVNVWPYASVMLDESRSRSETLELRRPWTDIIWVIWNYELLNLSKQILILCHSSWLYYRGAIKRYFLLFVRLFRLLLRSLRRQAKLPSRRNMQSPLCQTTDRWLHHLLRWGHFLHRKDYRQCSSVVFSQASTEHQPGVLPVACKNTKITSKIVEKQKRIPAK